MIYYVMLDVGGTQIKGGILTETGRLLHDISTFDAKSNRPKEEIFVNFADIISNLIDTIEEPDKCIAGIGFAFPGPFDYEHGISKMIGLNKYDSIYNCDFRQELIAVIKKKGTYKYFRKDFSLAFVHDVEAFAIGESHFGTAAGFSRAMYLCIGTGSGTSFTEDKIVLKKETINFPENGWIYKTPFRDSIIDDYVSSRGLQKLSAKYLKDPVEGRILYDQAVRGEETALLTFKEFGSDIKEAIEPFLESFSPDCLVLGGQVSKSFCFFGAELEQYCKEHQIAVRLTEDTSVSILKGLYVRTRR